MAKKEKIIVPVEGRSEAGKNACRRLRAAGRIPGNVYGMSLDPFAVTVDPRKVEIDRGIAVLQRAEGSVPEKALALLEAKKVELEAPGRKATLMRALDRLHKGKARLDDQIARNEDISRPGLSKTAANLRAQVADLNRAIAELEKAIDAD